MDKEYFDFANNIPVILYRCLASPEREIVFINDAIEDFMVDRNLLIAEGLTSMIFEEDRKHVFSSTKQLNAGFSSSIRYRIKRSDGKTQWVKDDHKVVDDDGTLFIDGAIYKYSSNDQMHPSGFQSRVDLPAPL